MPWTTWTQWRTKTTVISIIGEKSLDKLQRAFTIKALSTLRSDGNHVNKINSVKKITASITHNGRRLVTFPLRSGTSQGYPVLPLLFNIALEFLLSAVQCSSVAQSCPTLFDPMDHSTPGLPVHHQLPEFTQTHVHWVSDAIQPSHPLSSPSPPAPKPSEHQGLFQWVNSSREVAK